MGETLLEVKDIRVFYGNIEAVKGMSFRVDKGEIVTLIGANGAGKTTTLRTVSGLLKPREGAIFYDNQRIDLSPAHEIVKLGVAQSPEGRRIFPRMTVRENLDMGAFIRKDAAQALSLANRGYVIETGNIVLEDDARALLTSEQVRKAYLGEE